jgi:hypothetical protein
MISNPHGSVWLSDTAFTMLVALLVELTTLPILLKTVNPRVNQLLTLVN